MPWNLYYIEQQLFLRYNNVNCYLDRICNANRRLAKLSSLLIGDLS